jgi:hypothetical protein
MVLEEIWRLKTKGHSDPEIASILNERHSTTGPGSDYSKESVNRRTLKDQNRFKRVAFPLPPHSSPDHVLGMSRCKAFSE